MDGELLAASQRLSTAVRARCVWKDDCGGKVGGGEREVTRGRLANFRIQAPAGGLRSALGDGAASPAAPDPERSATLDRLA